MPKVGAKLFLSSRLTSFRAGVTSYDDRYCRNSGELCSIMMLKSTRIILEVPVVARCTLVATLLH